MFGYNYGIQNDDQGNKVLNISISLNYISASDDIKMDELESILHNYNPIGLLRESIKNIYDIEY